MSRKTIPFHSGKTTPYPTTSHPTPNSTFSMPSYSPNRTLRPTVLCVTPTQGEEEGKGKGGRITIDAFVFPLTLEAASMQLSATGQDLALVVVGKIEFGKRQGNRILGLNLWDYYNNSFRNLWNRVH